MVERVDIIDADKEVRNVATLDALITLVGDLTENPADNTLLERLKGLSTQLATMVTSTDQVETLLNAINQSIVQIQTIDGLTNAQLRASPLPLMTGAATQTTLAAVLAVLQGTLTITGALTDAQLRASSLPLMTGAATSDLQTTGNTKLDTIIEHVDGLETGIGLVNTTLSGALSVTGPLTSAQLASAGLATQTTLAAILSAIQAQMNLATTLWTDDSGAFYVRRDVIDQDSGTYAVSFTNPTGGAATTGVGLRPAANEESLSTETILYEATSAGTGYSIGDAVMRSVTFNQNTTPPTVVASFWLNLTSGSIIAAPTSGHMTKAATNTNVSSSALPAGAATSSLQTSGNSSLSSILSALQGTLAVSGPLTDAQLRATVLPVSVSTLPLPSGAATQTTLASVLSALQGTLAVSGPLTDAQLRAAAVPVSGPLTDAQLRATALPVSAASLPLPAGAATQTTLASVLSALQGTLAVSGPLTDAQLRATAVPVSGPLTDTQLRATALPVSASALPLPAGAATEASLADIVELLSGPLQVEGDFGTGVSSLTDTELRASPVPVSGPLTDTQLRATALPVSAASLPLPAGAATQSTVAAVLAQLQSGLAVSGPVTDAQLRAAALPVSVATMPLPTGAATETTLGSVLTKLNASVAVTGPLTDTQLRATALPVSVASLPLPTGAATQTTLASVLSALQGTLAVSGPLTDTQLRATALPISASSLPLPTGAATQTTLASVLSALQGTLTVSAGSLPLPTGAATQTTLASVLSALQGTLAVSAASLPLPTGAATQTTLASVLSALQGTLAVSGPLTDTQLRATAVPISAASLPLPSGAATATRQDNQQTTLNSILSTLQAQVTLATTLWTDDSNAFYVRRDIVDQDSGTYSVVFTTPTGSAATPGVGLRPAANEESLATQTVLFDAIDSGTGYTTGDAIMRSVTVNQNTSPPTVVASFWLNLTSGAVIATPNLAHVQEATGSVIVTSSALPSGAATSALQGTGNTTLSSILSALGGSLAVTGPLTDAQLRSSAIPITATALPLPAGAATSALQTTGNSSLSSIVSALGGTLAVSGPLTDIQLRATAVPVSGPLTDTQLRATAVPVSGPVTDAQLRATALPVSASALPLPTGAATSALQTTGNSSLSSIVSALGGTLAVSAGSLPLPTGAATSANQTALAALVGEVQTTPTANTLLDRVKTLATLLTSITVNNAGATSTSRLLSSAASANPTVVKASAGSLGRIVGRNNRAASVYLKIYNKATTPDQTDTPRYTFEIPAYSMFTLDGKGSFSTGISYRITLGSADNDTASVTSGDITCMNIDYE